MCMIVVAGKEGSPREDFQTQVCVEYDRKGNRCLSWDRYGAASLKTTQKIVQFQIVKVFPWGLFR
jgi:hypothetical protein